MATWAFVLGLLAGLAIGALAVLALVRSTSRLTGAAPRALPGLVLDGLLPGRARSGVVAQRALARRLKRTGERTAAGRRVAASVLEVHVSPEDHESIDEAMGLGAAEADLLDFYGGHASRAGWIVGARPELTIVRDISLRPRQAFVRAETRAGAAADPDGAGARPAAVRAAPPRRTDAVHEDVTDVVPRADEAAVTDVVPRSGDAALTDVVPRSGDAALTDVLPRGAAEEGVTRSSGTGMPEQAQPGDLLVVHGTDVRVVPVGRGLATVGRAAHNDIVVSAPGVADDHLLLEHRQQAWWVVPGPSGAKTSMEGRALRGGQRVEGQGVVELGRGARLRLSVEPAR